MVLPDEVLQLVERAPLEDVLLPLVRARLRKGVSVQSLYEMNPTLPLVIIRRHTGLNSGGWADPRFLSGGLVQVNCLTEGLDADEDAARLSESVRVILRDAHLNQTVVPGVGHLAVCEERQAPRRSADFATAVGPVQYADLPTGVVRYESTYYVVVRQAL